MSVFQPSRAAPEMYISHYVYLFIQCIYSYIPVAQLLINDYYYEVEWSVSASTVAHVSTVFSSRFQVQESSTTGSSSVSWNHQPRQSGME